MKHLLDPNRFAEMTNKLTAILKAVSAIPELTCHSVEDLRILNSREMTRYAVSDEDIDIYAKEVIPYWLGRSMRDRVFGQVPQKWRAAYAAGMFTEFKK